MRSWCMARRAHSAFLSARSGLPLLISLAWQTPRAALACSGPGAAEAIHQSDLFVLGAVLCVLCCFLAGLLVPGLRRRLTRKALLGLGLAVPFHPALLMGTTRGDCGYTARWLALGSIPLILGLFAFLVYRGQRRLAAASALPG